MPTRSLADRAIADHVFGDPPLSWDDLAGEGRTSIGIPKELGGPERARVAPSRSPRRGVSPPFRYRSATQQAIQIHGGLGFTWEMGLRFQLRRVLALRELLRGLVG